MAEMTTEMTTVRPDGVDAINFGDKAVGPWLADLRAKRGWSQHGLGLVAGVPQTTISRIERGANEIDPAVMRKLTAALAQRIVDPRPQPAATPPMADGTPAPKRPGGGGGRRPGIPHTKPASRNELHGLFGVPRAVYGRVLLTVRSRKGYPRQTVADRAGGGMLAWHIDAIEHGKRTPTRSEHAALIKALGTTEAHVRIQCNAAADKLPPAKKAAPSKEWERMRQYDQRQKAAPKTAKKAVQGTVLATYMAEVAHLLLTEKQAVRLIEVLSTTQATVKDVGGRDDAGEEILTAFLIEALEG